MIEKLKILDAELFLFFNHLNNPVLDSFFFWVSNKWIWMPFYAILAFYLYRKFPTRFISILVFLGVMVAISDQVASSLLKNWVVRLRPCHDPMISSQVHLVHDYCGGMYGFVSSHAANSFALAFFMFKLIGHINKKIVRLLFVWATIVAYSRIYLGVHFPGDVLCGALLGVLTGGGVYQLFRYYEHNFSPYRKVISESYDKK